MVYVFGLGAIGSNILVSLAKRYQDHKFIGIDYDTVEDRNIGPQAYFLEHVGQPKAMVMPAVLGRFIRKVQYQPVNKKIENSSQIIEMMEDQGIANTGLILDCFDNTESREILKYSFSKNANLLHIGFSPQYTAEIMWNDSYDVPGKVDPANEDICENPDAAAFIGFVVNFASLVAMDFLDNGNKNNFIITQKYRIKQV